MISPTVILELDLLDSLTNKYLKKFVGTPRCGIDCILNMKEGLDIPTISTIYQEMHCPNRNAMIIKGDIAVNLGLDNAVERESEMLERNGSGYSY